MKRNMITIKALIMTLLVTLGCFISAYADETGGATEITEGDTNYSVTATIESSYKVIIPAEPQLTSTNPRATVNVSGTATIASNQRLCVYLKCPDEGFYLYDGNGTHKIKCDVSAQSDNDINFSTMIGNGIRIGEASGDGSMSFSTDLTFDISNNLSGVPAGTYSNTWTFYTWVESIS